MPVSTLPGMAERTLTISSLGKSYSFTGWKIGWASGPRPLVSAVRTTKQFLTFVSGGPLQYAAAYALTHERAWVEQLRLDLARRRDLLCDGLASVGLTPNRPRGTYFVTTDVRSIGWDDGMTFCRELPARAGRGRRAVCAVLRQRRPRGRDTRAVDLQQTRRRARRSDQADCQLQT